MLRLSGIITCGLLRTTPTDVAITISGFLFPEIELRQRLIGFWLRSLTYGIDISKGVEEQVVTNFCSPQDILLSEIRGLRPIRAIQNIVEERHQVERQLLGHYEPWKLHPPIDYIIRERETAIESLRIDRENSSSNTIWIFCDGSCTPIDAGAARLISQGCSTYYFSLSHRSTGIHSSTQMELEGIRMGLRMIDIFRHNWEIKEVRIVTDSKTAIMAVMGGWNKSELVVAIHTLLWRLHDSISSIQLSWIPGHSGVPENEAADFEAREAAEGASSSGISRIGQCHKALCTQVHKHYADRMNAMWKSLSSGQGLRDCDWYYRPSLMWTTRLTRSASSTLSQFLSNHFPCREYLHRWALHDDPSCRYCEAPIEDTEHILMHCPRYMTIRSRWLQIGQHRLDDGLTWDLQTLARIGLPFLAGFLQDVKLLWDKQQQGTSWGPR